MVFKGMILQYMNMSKMPYLSLKMKENPYFTGVFEFTKWRPVRDLKTLILGTFRAFCGNFVDLFYQLLSTFFQLCYNFVSTKK